MKEWISALILVGWVLYKAVIFAACLTIVVLIWGLFWLIFLGGWTLFGVHG